MFTIQIDRKFTKLRIVKKQKQKNKNTYLINSLQKYKNKL